MIYIAKEKISEKPDKLNGFFMSVISYLSNWKLSVDFRNNSSVYSNLEVDLI